jgi:hypothetical protein
VGVIYGNFSNLQGDSGEIILINSDVPRIIVREPEAVQIDTGRREEG